MTKLLKATIQLGGPFTTRRRRRRPRWSPKVVLAGGTLAGFRLSALLALSVYCNTGRWYDQSACCGRSRSKRGPGWLSDPPGALAPTPAAGNRSVVPSTGATKNVGRARSALRRRPASVAGNTPKETICQKKKKKASPSAEHTIIKI